MPDKAGGAEHWRLPCHKWETIGQGLFWKPFKTEKPRWSGILSQQETAVNTVSSALQQHLFLQLWKGICRRPWTISYEQNLRGHLNYKARSHKFLQWIFCEICLVKNRQIPAQILVRIYQAGISEDREVCWGHILQPQMVLTLWIWHRKKKLKWHFRNCPSQRKTATSCKLPYMFSGVLMDEPNRVLPKFMIWSADQQTPFCEIIWMCSNRKAAERCFR